MYREGDGRPLIAEYFRRRRLHPISINTERRLHEVRIVSVLVHGRTHSAEAKCDGAGGPCDLNVIEQSA